MELAEFREEWMVDEAELLAALEDGGYFEDAEEM